MRVDQSPKLAVRTDWASASTCGGSGVLPLAAFLLSHHAHPCTPRTLALLLFSEDLSTILTSDRGYPFLPCPALVDGAPLCWPVSWSHLRKAR